LLLRRRSTRDMGFPSPARQIPQSERCALAHSSLLRRASPSDLWPDNSTPRSFQTGSNHFFTPPFDRLRRSSLRKTGEPAALNLAWRSKARRPFYAASVRRPPPHLQVRTCAILGAGRGVDLGMAHPWPGPRNAAFRRQPLTDPRRCPIKTEFRFRLGPWLEGCGAFASFEQMRSYQISFLLSIAHGDGWVRFKEAFSDRGLVESIEPRTQKHSRLRRKISSGKIH